MRVVVGGSFACDDRWNSAKDGSRFATASDGGAFLEEGEDCFAHATGCPTLRQIS
jgi:hypothetical protein